MAKHGKKFTAAAAQVADRQYTFEEAIPLVQKVKFARFDETVELAMRLGVDPKHADQMVRGTVVLPHGLNIMDFCKNFNAKTAKDEGLIIPVVVTVYADRTYSFITKTPPASILLKKVANLAKGSAEPNRNKVGTVTAKQVEDIAKQKMPDLNCQDLDAAIRTVRGTARSMGIDVLG